MGREAKATLLGYIKESRSIINSKTQDMVAMQHTYRSRVKGYNIAKSIKSHKIIYPEKYAIN